MRTQPDGAAVADLDPLTGCYTRAALGRRLVDEMARPADCSLLLLDLDFFKSVNDAYGHARGDEVLRGAADRMRSLLRDQDILIRYGGDEFVVILPETGNELARTVARRLVDGVGSAPFPGQPPLALSISLGVATFPAEAADCAGLLAVADRRNYLAKRRGRAQAVADDEPETVAGGIESRLLERDAAVAAAADFLSGLGSGTQPGSGTLHVTGPAGAGHTRFLHEVAKLGRLRGFQVVTPAELAGVVPGAAGTLMIFDTTDSAALDDARALLRQAGPETPIGLVYATTHSSSAVADDSLELSAWSTAAVRTFLRTSLRGEPSSELVNWLDSHSGGLPGLVGRELTRLVEIGALERVEAGWTITAAVRDEASGEQENLAASVLRLPPPVPDFTGRDTEVAALVGMSGASVASIYGPPGVGKTALAVHAGHALSVHFPDGQWYLDMLGTDDRPLEPADALARVLAALGVRAERIPPSVAERTALYRTLTQDRRLVLVLDNVLNEGQVRPLLPTGPTFLVFVTSRRSLAGLAGARRVALDSLNEESAVRLLAEIAGAERVAAEPEATAEVARLCGNLPLALRIAGNRLASRPAWTIDHLARQLGNSRRRLGVLTAGDLAVRSVFALSYRQLSEPAQATFRRLALIPGPDFDAVLAGALIEQDPFDAEDLLAELVDASLIELAAIPGRYRFNELLRLYAREVLVSTDSGFEADEKRLVGWLAAVAARAGMAVGPPDEQGPSSIPVMPGEPSFPSTAAAVAWLDAEWGNWLAALRFAATSDRHAEVMRLAWAMHWYSDVRWYRSEWREVFAMGVDAARALGDRAAECVLVDYLAWTYTMTREIPAAEPLLMQALALARELGDRTEEGWALLYLGNCCLRTDRAAEALEFYGQGATVFRELDFRTGLSIALSHLGEAHRCAGDLVPALELQEEAAVVAEEIDNFVGQGGSLCRAGRVLIELGRPAEAIDRLTGAIAAYEQVDAIHEKGMTLQLLAEAQLSLGHTEAAVTSLTAATEIFAKACDPEKQAEVGRALDQIRSPATAR